MQHRKTRRGFTLIEVLVVVLIIGVLAAIALPMYNRAVLRSRFNALMPIVKAMNDSNEAYYLEHGSYASNPQDLPVQGQSSYPTGTELEFGNNMDYAYVLAYNADAKNNYIMYQKHSANYPGEIHCEAITGDDLAEYVCESAGGTTNLGTTLTEGYTTYVIQGTGAGFAPGADSNGGGEEVSCDAATAMGYTCNMSTNEQGQTVKQLCTAFGVCRTKTYNEDGSYTSVTCLADGNGVCTGDLKSATYDANGNQLTKRWCSSVDSSGNCTAYSSGYDYTYDANGNQLTYRICSSVDSSGNCTAYASSGNYNYTYDANGNKLTEWKCSSVDSSGNCTAYSNVSNWTYDESGKTLTERKCSGSNIDSNGSCTAYNEGTDYTYNAAGNKATTQWCNQVNSNGACSTYSSYNISEYTYDAAGNILTKRDCYSVNSSGSCASYSSSNAYNYTYDANGNLLTKRGCISVDSSGNCTNYQATGGDTRDYTYDANGNMLTERVCKTVNSSGTCTQYSYAHYYTYDDNGKYIANQYCDGNNLNTATGECTAFSSTSTTPQAY